MSVAPNFTDLTYDEATIAATEAIQQVAHAIDHLDSSLNDAAQRIDQLKVVRAELELGEIFAKAQNFVESTIKEAETKAREIIDSATAEATRIIDHANREASVIVETANSSSVPSPEVVRELSDAISGFLTVNQDLVRELGSLQAYLLEPISA